MAKKTASKKQSIYDKIRKEREDIKNRAKNNLSYWRPDEGKHTLRLVRFSHDGEELLYATDSRHWYDSGNRRAFAMCPGASKGCPICALKKLVDEETWKTIYPSRKFYYNAVLRGPKGDTLVVAQLGVKVHNQICEVLTDAEDDGLDPLNEKNGNDIKLTRSGNDTVASLVTKASVVKLPKPAVDLLSSLPKSSMEDLERVAQLLKKAFGVEDSASADTDTDDDD